MKRRPKDPDPVFVSDDRRCEVRAALCDNDGDHRGDVVLRYDADDPLVVDVSVRSCADAVVLSRAVLRSDLATGTVTTVRARDLLLGPAVGERVRVVFYEGKAMIEATFPAEMVRRFVRATERIVPVDRETEIVERLIVSELGAGIERDGRA